MSVWDGSRLRWEKIGLGRLGRSRNDRQEDQRFTVRPRPAYQRAVSRDQRDCPPAIPAITARLAAGARIPYNQYSPYSPHNCTMLPMLPHSPFKTWISAAIPRMTPGLITVYLLVIRSVGLQGERRPLGFLDFSSGTALLGIPNCIYLHVRIV